MSYVGFALIGALVGFLTVYISARVGSKKVRVAAAIREIERLSDSLSPEEKRRAAQFRAACYMGNIYTDPEVRERWERLYGEVDR